MATENLPVFFNSPGDANNLLKDSGYFGHTINNSQNTTTLSSIAIGNTLMGISNSNGLQGVVLSPLSVLDCAPVVGNNTKILGNITDSSSVGNGSVISSSVPVGLTIVDQDNYPNFFSTSGAFNLQTPLPMVQLDVPRTVDVYVVTTTTAGAGKLTVYGLDVWGQALQEEIDIAAGTAVGAKAGSGKKSFMFVFSVAISVATTSASALSVCLGNIIGLPYYCSSKGYVISATLDGAAQTVTVTVGSTLTASATTGDVRGTIGINGTFDGAKHLVVTQYVPGASYSDIANAGQVTYGGLYGLPQYNPLNY